MRTACTQQTWWLISVPVWGKLRQTEVGTLAKVLTQGGYFKLGKGENTSHYSERQSVVVSQCLPYPLPTLRSRVFNHRV